jgi:hypothetical protein
MQFLWANSKLERLGVPTSLQSGANYVLHRIELVYGKTPIGHIMMFNKTLLCGTSKIWGRYSSPIKSLWQLNFVWIKWQKQMGSGLHHLQTACFKLPLKLLAHNSSLVSTHFPNECLVGCNLCPSHLTLLKTKHACVIPCCELKLQLCWIFGFRFIIEYIVA